MGTPSDSVHPTIHVITRLRGAGKYCEIWLEPELRRSPGYSVAPKWDELHDLVERAGLDDAVINHGYRGLRAIVCGDRIIALSTSPERPAGALEPHVDHEIQP